jgi:hypothetical protein
MPFKTYRPSKADAARAVAAQLKAEGKPVRPKTVLEILAKRGIVMDPGQCSVITGEFRKRRKRTWTRRAPKVRAVSSNGRATQSNGNGAPGGCTPAKVYNHLVLAAQFAKSCGDIHKARQALADLATIVDPFVKS